MKLKHPLIAISFALAGLYSSASHAQIVKYELCNGYDVQGFERTEDKFHSNSRQQLEEATKIAEVTIRENNRMVSKGGIHIKYHNNLLDFRSNAKRQVLDWPEGGAGAKIYYFVKEAGVSCPYIKLGNGRYDERGNKQRNYIWDETKIFVGGDGRIKGWLESFMGEQLCESAPKPCGGGLTNTVRRDYEGHAEKLAKSAMTWVGAPIQERLNTPSGETKYIGAISDGKGGKIHEYGFKWDDGGAGATDYDQINRYYVDRSGTIYGYGGWLSYGEVPICAGGGNLGICGKNGQVLLKKHIDPSKLRRDGY